MKTFLLMAGDQYYPESGDNNWIGCFETEEEAEAMVSVVKIPGNKYLVSRFMYEINGRKYDWYDIVNLKEWMEK